jgi:cytochrome c oxidase cbb3-type subunit 3
VSDFVSSGWAIYIAAATVLGMVGCIALLVFASRGKVQSGDNTTGHVWDVDLRELNNPLPRWWMWLFVGTVVFSFVYLALYPGLGSYAGTLNWTSRNQLEAEQARARQAMAPVYAKFKTMTPEQLAADPQAMAIGQRLFLNQCAQCHGSDARGSKGFPDLTRPAPARLATETPEQIAAVIVDGRTGIIPGTLWFGGCSGRRDRWRRLGSAAHRAHRAAGLGDPLREVAGRPAPAESGRPS